MEILQTFENNAGPEPHILAVLDTPDGAKIRYAIFRTDIKAHKGTILLLHGRNECIEKYFETIIDFNALGFDVATFDWRGQGGSSRFFKDARRGHIDSYHQYVADLDQVFTDVLLPECRAPFFLVAHSTGSLVALLAAPIMVNRLRRMVLASPFLGIGDETLTQNQVTGLSGFLNFIGLSNMHMGGSPNGIAAIPFELNRLTTDPDRYERNQQILDPANGLGVGSATAGWLNASMKAVEEVFKTDHMANIHIPTLLITSGADRVVANSAIEDYAARLRSGALITIDGARHELMQEADQYRDQLLAAIDAFIPGTGV